MNGHDLGITNGPPTATEMLAELIARLNEQAASIAALEDDIESLRHEVRGTGPWSG